MDPLTQIEEYASEEWVTTKSGVQLSNKAYRGGLQGIIVSGRVRARTPCLGVSPTLSDCAVRRACRVW